jgi:glucose-6-phosphate dehydrogenase assembly protein OpcA
MMPSEQHATRLGTIDTELRSMWRSLAARAPAGAIVRSACLNWIYVLPVGADEVVDTVTAVAAELPCRVLVVESLPVGSPVAPTASLRAFCSLEAADGRQLCVEQVTLSAPEDRLEALASTLLALLLADLPTVLFWPAQPALAGALLARLGGAVDRLVADSTGFASPALDFARLQAWSSAARTVADLTWDRLDAWRELVAGFFDAPPFASQLATLRRAAIDYEPGARAAALLASGWLASRLGWELVQPAAGGWTFDAPGGSIELRLRECAGPSPRPHLAPSLLRIALEDASATRYVVEPEALHRTLLAARIESVSGCPLPQHLPCPAAATATSLLRTLAAPAHNPAFEQALASAVILAGASCG